MSENKKDHYIQGVKKYRLKSSREILKNTKKISKSEKIPLKERLRIIRHGRRSIR